MREMEELAMMQSSERVEITCLGGPPLVTCSLHHYKYPKEQQELNYQYVHTQYFLF